MLNQTPPLSEYIHAPLMAIVNLIPPNCRITIRRDPDSGKVVWVNSIVYELACEDGRDRVLLLTSFFLFFYFLLLLI